MKKNSLLLMAWALLVLPSFAQNVAINEDGSLPNPHAIVDIKSSTKGVLIPRMNTAARLTITNTKGLLVYDTDNNLFWYNTGTQWKSITTDDLSNQNGQAWLLKGNSNTQDKINFLGTINNVPLKVRVNNQPSGMIDPFFNNTYWGYQAGKSDTLLNFRTSFGNSIFGYQAFYSNTFGGGNTASGVSALFSNIAGNYNTAKGFSSLFSNTTGNNNTAVGDFTLLLNKTGFSNVAIGTRAMYSSVTTSNTVAIGDSALFKNASGFKNSAVGSKALYSNTTGSYNTANGYQALFSNTTGDANTANGFADLFSNTTGYYNSADGDQALYNNITGINNTANGNIALFSNTTGNYNSAIGSTALFSNKTGNNLTALGAGADVLIDGLINATAIGYGAVVNASNKVRIGNPAVTVIEGQVPFTTPSDGRFKFNIHENVKGLDFILKLRPITYQFDVKKQEAFTRGNIKPGQISGYATPVVNDEATQMIRTGFIAQEVEQAAKKTGYDFDGVKIPKTEKEYYSLSYSSFVVPLVKAVQEQQQTIQEQNQRIANLEQQLAEIKKLLQSSH